VTDDEGFSSPVDGRFLKSYAWAIEEALEAGLLPAVSVTAEKSTAIYHIPPIVMP